MNITGRNDIYKDHYVIDNIKMQWIGSRDAMHGVSTPKIMYGYFRNRMHRIPIGNILWNVHCTVTVETRCTASLL